MTAAGLERHSASAAAQAAIRLLAAGTPMEQVWRHVVVQLLDDYCSVARQHGVAMAADLFTEAPEATGDQRFDAALAALAEHLSRADDWRTPAWAWEPDRVAVTWWFVTPLEGLHAQVLRESPLSFRTRGVFISADALSRV